MSHTRAFAIVVMAVGLLAGCSPSSAPKTATPTTVEAISGLPCGKLGPAPPTARTGPPLRAVPRGEFAMEADGSFLTMALWSHYLGYLHGDGGHDRVAVCDLDTGRVVTITETKGALRPSWMNGAGTTVVYTEIDTETQPDADDPTVFDPDRPVNTPPPPGTRMSGLDWRVHSYDLKTGKRRELARSRSKADTEIFVVPAPEVEGRWVAWAQASGYPTGERNQYQVVSFDLATGRTRTIGGGVGPGTLSLAGGVVYFNALDDRNPPHLMLWSAPADGSAPQSVVPGGDDVLRSDVRGKLATWASYVARSPLADDNHFPIIGRRLGPAGVPATLGRAFDSTSTGTLVMWTETDSSHEGKEPDGLMVADPSFPDRPLKLVPSREVAGHTGNGDLIAWFDRDGDHRVHLVHIVR